jgi:hypothetical protein
MSYMNWWREQIAADSDATITVEDWDKYKEENITPCTPSGELRMKRIVANPELCKAEAAAGIREDDPYSFKSEYGEKCCSLHAGEYPQNGTYCAWEPDSQRLKKITKRANVSSNGIGQIDMKLESKNDDVCAQDVKLMEEKFLFQNKFSYNKNYRDFARKQAWKRAIKDGTAYLSTGYWGKSRDDDSVSVKRACYSNGTIEGSDINWGKYVDPDPEVSTNRRCGGRGESSNDGVKKRCPEDQCCSEYGWCGGKIGTNSDYCSKNISGKGWSGGEYKGRYDGIHYNMPKDTDWSITK